MFGAQILGVWRGEPYLSSLNKTCSSLALGLQWGWGFLSSFSRFVVQGQAEVFKAESQSSFFSEQSGAWVWGSDMLLATGRCAREWTEGCSSPALPPTPRELGRRPWEQKLESFPSPSFQKYDVMSVMLKHISRF